MPKTETKRPVTLFSKPKPYQLAPLHKPSMEGMGVSQSRLDVSDLNQPR